MNINIITQKISSFLQGKNIKTLLTNFIALVILQGLNVLLPFLTIPYLISTVGLDLFGLITFSYSFAFFFQIITEYGFNTVTSREISINSDNLKNIQQLFSDVFFTKMILVLILFIVYIIIVFSVPKFSEYSLLYIIQYGCVIGQALFPVWLFQGLQRMKYITLINVICKTLFTIAIFLLVKSPEDYWIAPLCTALGLITSGISSLIITYFHFNIGFVKSSVQGIKLQLKQGFYVFVSELQIAAIANGNILILGLIAGNESVGIYTAAEKIIRAIGNLQAPLINTLYPYISKEMNIDKIKTFHILNKIRLYISLLILFICGILFVGADLFFKIIYGDGFEKSILVFRIILLFPILSFLDQFYGKLILLTNHQEKNFMKVFLITSILSVILSCIFSYYFDYIGLAISNLIIQILIAYGMFYFAKKIPTL